MLLFPELHYTHESIVSICQGSITTPNAHQDFGRRSSSMRYLVGYLSKTRLQGWDISKSRSAGITNNSNNGPRSHRWVCQAGAAKIVFPAHFTHLSWRFAKVGELIV